MAHGAHLRPSARPSLPILGPGPSPLRVRPASSRRHPSRPSTQPFKFTLSGPARASTRFSRPGLRPGLELRVAGTWQPRYTIQGEVWLRPEAIDAVVGAGWGLTGRCVLWHRHGHLRQARIPRQRAAHLGCGRRRARTAGSHGVRVPPLRIDIPLHRCLCVDKVAQSQRQRCFRSQRGRR